MRTPRNPRTRRDLTTAEAAELLGIDQDTVRANAARLGGRKVLGRWRFSAAAVHAAARGTTPTTTTEDTP